MNIIGNSATRFKSPKWPFIEQMLNHGRISYIDYALAERLLRDHADASEEAAAFICHLSIAMREGHLCINVTDHTLYPSPKHTWIEGKDSNDDGEVIPENTLEDWNKITDLITRGASLIPSSLVTDVSKSCSVPITPICRHGSYFYFQRYWLYEMLFLKHFQTIMSATPALVPNLTTIQNEINLLQQQKQLLPEQAQAILAVCMNSFTVICGGPGTGKTYTAGNLIKIFWSALDAEQRKNCEIALAAPTGKAAANLQRSLCAATTHLEGFSQGQFKAKTLHALLGIRPQHSQRNAAIAPLSADLIIVDESSMIDANLMGQLLSAVKPGARLVLLGDRHQLPPVSSGAFFSDIIAHLTTQAPTQIVELVTCLRMELKAIIDFAATINLGDSDAVIKALSQSSIDSGISRLILNGASSHPKVAQQDLIAHISPHFHKPWLEKDNHRQLLEAFQQFRLLSPLRKGPFGIEELNRLIYGHFIKKMRHQPWFCAPIMLTSNDHRLNLFNGEVGVLVRHGDGSDAANTYLKEEDFALFLDGSGEHADEIRKLPALILPKYEYAYCLSVHKSQGSEFEHVLLMLPEGSERFGREVLYTAATRARKQLEVWGSDQVLREATLRQASRLSGVEISRFK